MAKPPTKLVSHSPIPHTEVSVALQSPDEQQQEGLVDDQLAEEPERLLPPLEVGSVAPLQHRVVLLAREQDLHAVGAVLEERDAEAGDVRGQVCHLGLKFRECCQW